MKRFTVKINSKSINVFLTTTSEEASKGLSGAQSTIAQNVGMMFKLGAGQYMVTEDTIAPLDMIFLNSSLKITGIVKYPNTYKKAKISPIGGAKYCIEVGSGEVTRLGIKTGDSMDIPESMGFALGLESSSVKKLANGGSLLPYSVYDGDVNIDYNLMNILDKNGKVIMNVEGPERIFSIGDTKIAIELSKKYRETNDKSILAKLVEHINQSLIRQKVATHSIEQVN